MRKTKIVCTIGPATDSDEMMRSLMVNGMNVARFNFSHETHESHGKRIDQFKRIRKELGLRVGLLLDTKGPEIRLGTFKDGKAVLKAGDQIILTTKQVEGTKDKVSITYKDLPEDISIKNNILIDDGLIKLEVLAIDGADIICKVIDGGPVSNRKAVNVPGVKLSMPYISKKDREDLKFGVKKGVDFIAASFARSAVDMLEIKSILEENGGKHIQVIAKIENQDGVNNVDEILKVSDGIMVARGDMGV